VRFLLDANLPRSVVGLLQKSGLECVHVRDCGLASAADAEIAAYAQCGQFTLITRDIDFADIRTYPPERYAGLVVCRLPDTATAVMICELISQLISQADVIGALPGRLALVEFGRVRLRPPLDPK